jgi:hypothetical protein
VGVKRRIKKTLRCHIGETKSDGRKFPHPGPRAKIIDGPLRVKQTRSSKIKLLVFSFMRISVLSSSVVVRAIT